MSKENIANRFKKIKTNIEDFPTPVVQKVDTKKDRKSPKKEGIEYKVERIYNRMVFDET